MRFIVRFAIVFLLALNLAACAGKASGNSLGGVLDDVSNGADAYKRASEHCAAFKKSAKITQLNGDTAAFDCI